MSAKITFGTWEQADKVNPYIETVKAMIEAGEATSLILEIPYDDVVRERNLLSKAANELGKTARLRVKDESAVKASKPDKDGNVTHTGDVKLTFTLTKRHKARRGDKSE